MKVEIIKTKDWGYTVEINGVVALECVGEADLSDITLKDIMDCAKEIEKEGR